MVRNPVMFTVEIGTVVMLAVVLYQMVTGDTSQGALWYNITVFAILLVTVLFANFAEAIAEARGKAQAESLTKNKRRYTGKKGIVVGEMYVNEIKIVPSSQLQKR